MARITRVEILQVDLVPLIKRTDAIQSFVKQETPMVRITTDDGVVVIGSGPSRQFGERYRKLIEDTTGKRVLEVIITHKHPDHFLGNQAFRDVPIRADAKTTAMIQAEGEGLAENLYRLVGDGMRGTEALLPTGTVGGGPMRLGTRELELREYRGHTDSDLVLVDKSSGVVFAGGLVFAQRIPTTPHAQVGPWLQSLRAFAALPVKTLVPSHGPVRADASAVGQTQRYLQWIDGRFRQLAEQGAEMNEVLRSEVPAEFRGWAAFGTEYTRNVAHLYPRYEQAVLRGDKSGTKP